MACRAGRSVGDGEGGEGLGVARNVGSGEHQIVERVQDCGAAALEVNLSCPNVQGGRLPFATDPAMAARVIALVRAATRKPVLAKLSPNVSDIAAIARAVEVAGADAITLHLREDRRHIQDRDVAGLREIVAGKLNLEMSTADEMIAFALEHRPDQITLVPERPEEVTTEGGLDLPLGQGLHDPVAGGIPGRIVFQGRWVLLRQAHLEVGVEHARGRNVQVVLGGVRQEACRIPGPLDVLPRVVDDGVPAAPFKSIQKRLCVIAEG